MLGTINH